MQFVLDINETLLDLTPLDDLLGGREQRVRWFDLMIRTALVRTAAQDYRPFGAIGIDAARALGVDLEPASLRSAMSSLPPHPDVVEGLASLRSAGHDVVALGNSARDLVEAQLTNAGIAGHFTGFYSADDVQALKPAPAAYRHVLEQTGTAPEDAVMVAAHDWDVAGAASAGMRTVFVDRGLRPPLPGYRTDLVVQRVADVVGVA